LIRNDLRRVLSSSFDAMVDGRVAIACLRS
jgi:hypothetical protein